MSENSERRQKPPKVTPVLAVRKGGAPPLPLPEPPPLPEPAPIPEADSIEPVALPEPGEDPSPPESSAPAEPAEASGIVDPVQASIPHADLQAAKLYTVSFLIVSLVISVAGLALMVYITMRMIAWAAS